MWAGKHFALWIMPSTTYLLPGSQFIYQHFPCFFAATLLCMVPVCPPSFSNGITDSVPDLLVSLLVDRRDCYVDIPRGNHYCEIIQLWLPQAWSVPELRQSTAITHKFCGSMILATLKHWAFPWFSGRPELSMWSVCLWWCRHLWAKSCSS